MTEQTPTRRCGNCGQEVGDADTLCPHCDALLVAYEPPAGATAGTSAAIHPVDMETTSAPVAQESPGMTIPEAAGPSAPYESPTAQTLDALDAHKPHAGTLSTTFTLPKSSPVAEALERTRVAADLDAQGELPPETPVPAGPNVATDERQALGMPTSPIEIPDLEQPAPSPPERRDEGPQSTAVERFRAQADAGWYDDNSSVRDIASRATRTPATRPTPEQRASHQTPPVRPSSRGTTARDAKSPSLGSVIGLFIIVVFVMRSFGSGAMTGFIVLPIIIAGLIWLMVTVAKNSGRKTTSMPKDKNHRR